jgi:hypothetical protein
VIFLPFLDGLLSWAHFEVLPTLYLRVIYILNISWVWHWAFTQVFWTRQWPKPRNWVEQRLGILETLSIREGTDSLNRSSLSLNKTMTPNPGDHPKNQTNPKL